MAYMRKLALPRVVWAEDIQKHFDDESGMCQQGLYRPQALETTQGWCGDKQSSHLG